MFVDLVTDTEGFLELFFRLFYTLLGSVYLRVILRACLHGGGGPQVGEVPA